MFLIQVVIQQGNLRPIVFCDKNMVHPLLLRRYVAVFFHLSWCCGSNLEINGQCWKQVCVQEATIGRGEEEDVEMKNHWLAPSASLVFPRLKTLRNSAAETVAALAASKSYATIPKGLHSENR